MPEYRARPAQTPEIFASLGTLASFPIRPPFLIEHIQYIEVSMVVAIKFIKNRLGFLQSFEVYMNHYSPVSLSLVLLVSCTPKNNDSGLLKTTEPSCLTDGTPVESFEIFPNLPATQIHADIAFDGQWIWTVFNLPNEDSDFDVYLGAIDCTGNVVVEPKQILDLTGFNQTTPRIAISNDNILIAAQGDNGGSANNLSIHLYIQSLDGELVSEREWSPVIDSVEIGNRWLPSISGDSDGFWLAAAAANGSHFQTAVQRLNTNGDEVGSPFWVGPNTFAVFPNIDGTPTEFVAAWESGDNSVQWAMGTMEGGDDYIEQSNSSSPKVLWNDGTPTVFANRRSPLAVTMNDAQLSLLGNSHFPNAATGSTRTLISYFFRIQSGYANDVYISTLVEGEISEQDTVVEANTPAAPYRPAVTNIGGDAFLMVWSGGENPNFMLTGQFIDLTTTD